MSEVCHDVSKEPSLQPLSGESLSLRTCNRDDGARVDIKASGFWGGRFQSSFFDVNPYAPSNQSNPYCQHEGAKRWAYRKSKFVRSSMQVLALLCFPPLEARGASTTVAYKRLAFLLSLKWKIPFCKVMRCLRCLFPLALYHSVH